MRAPHSNAQFPPAKNGVSTAQLSLRVPTHHLFWCALFHWSALPLSSNAQHARCAIRAEDKATRAPTHYFLLRSFPPSSIAQYAPCLKRAEYKRQGPHGPRAQFPLDSNTLVLQWPFKNHQWTIPLFTALVFSKTFIKSKFINIFSGLAP